MELERQRAQRFVKKSACCRADRTGVLAIAPFAASSLGK